MAKFRKKPVVIEAVQYSARCWKTLTEAQDEIADFMDQNVNIFGDNIEIQTLEGPIFASPGDWIIRGIGGEFYPCKPDIFEKTYDPANQHDRDQIDMAIEALENLLGILDKSNLVGNARIALSELKERRP